MKDSMLGRPAVTPFVECPNCERLVEYGAKMCPDCREEISDEYAAVSAAVVFYNTQACSAANTIKTADPAAVIILCISAYSFFTSSPAYFVVSVAVSLLSLVVISVWFFRYGRLPFGDEEFAAAKRDMKGSFKLWAALLAVQALALLYLLDGRRHT